MVLNKVTKNNIIRIFVLLLLLAAVTIASSSVYAQHAQKMPETASAITNSYSAHSESDLYASSTDAFSESSQSQLVQTELLSEENQSATSSATIYTVDSYSASFTAVQIPDTPLVQPLTMQPASVTTLYQGFSYDTFFENTVFIGDSISVGFANYCQYSSDSISSDSTYFLAKEGCAAYIVTSELALTKYADRMPSYQGQLQYIEDSVSQMENIDKAIICYGINDLVGSTPEEYINDITVLVDRILEKNPDLSIYMISIPCIAEAASSGFLCNDSIITANQLLEDACVENGWGFINLTEYLMNENLAICAEYSSDNYVHQNRTAYQIWTKVLRNYAYEQTKE